MKFFRAVTWSIILNGLCGAGCRESAGWPSDDCEVGPPNTVLRPTPDHPADENEENDPDNENFAIEVRFQTGCDDDATEVAAPKAHATHGSCEHLFSSAFTEDGRELPSERVSFIWKLSHPEIVDVGFAHTSSATVGILHGQTDALDGAGEEPHADITACALNDCPSEAHGACQPTICQTIPAYSIVNIEGFWRLEGATFEEPQSVTFKQNGRFFKNPYDGIKRGVVHGRDVSFEINDNGYYATLSHDRTMLSGTVIDLLAWEPLGSWTAVRE
ncbi:hypothetical protein HY479_01900 [Candidatus Uhrbacteria bacterium]|nr:hypothetical protein [Candidatus Uhrbacteria bacterium]